MYTFSYLPPKINARRSTQFFFFIEVYLIYSIMLVLSVQKSDLVIFFLFLFSITGCSVQFSRSVMSDSLWPHELQHARPSCPSPTPRVHSNSRECTDHSKHPLPTTQKKTLHMDITRWSTPKSDWLYSVQPKMEKLYTVSKNKTRSWLWLRSWTPYCQIQTYIEESRENH